MAAVMSLLVQAFAAVWLGGIAALAMRLADMDRATRCNVW
ncbi:hypothetical protein AT5A_23695 [Agrobacterium tumefaciens 5A]|nr:hypothetical protein AT5A_23695 [Agrobacterium tumefaciens 5A]CUX04030.1 conserved hypothetical protein [Agrobacterium fabacearum S56]